ncbi:MAG: hypothetical protein AAFY88_25990, partial [Acidobacteriota bacterium]
APRRAAPHDEVRALKVYDDGSGPALFVAGSFTQVGSLVVNRIAKWDGQGFSPLPGKSGVGVEGTGLVLTAQALEAVDAGDGEKLYVSGIFDQAGGQPIADLASWDGSVWRSPVGDGSGFSPSSSGPRVLAAFGDGAKSLFMAGEFSEINGVVSNGIGEYRAEGVIFADGFESGDTTAWTSSVP